MAIAQYTGEAAEGDLEALAHEDVNDSARAEFLVDYATGAGNDVLDDFRVGQVAVVAAIWALQVPFSSWWLSRFRFGPFEWLWRTLSYLEIQPMTR